MRGLSAWFPEQLTERLQALGLATRSRATPALRPRCRFAHGSVSPRRSLAERDAAPECEVASNGLYCVYTVKAGDTLSAYCRRFGMTGTGDLSAAEMLARAISLRSSSPTHRDRAEAPRPGAERHHPHCFGNQTPPTSPQIYGVDEDDI